jgi:hypothetical protein
LKNYNLTIPETHPSYDTEFEKNFSKFIVLKGGFLTDTADKIIMGTFPPPKTKLLSHGTDYFYYPNNRNQFWNIIDSANNELNLGIDKLKFTSKSLETFNSNIQRKADFSIKQNWAFLDFFCKVERRVENSSKDVDLIDKENVIQNKTLYQYLNINIKIKQISCTFQTAFKNLVEHLNRDKFAIIEGDNNKKLWIYQDRKILINLLPPPTRSFTSLREKVKQYNSFLYH